MKLLFRYFLRYFFGLLACAVLFGFVFTLSSGVSEKVMAVIAAGRKLPIYCVETEEPVVALTFDAAWGNEDTDALIGILEQYGAKATFFVTGDFAERFPDDIKKFSEKGHDIANHSYGHPHIDQLSYEELKADTDKCNAVIQELTGQSPLLYRGPYGEYNNTILEILEAQGQYCIQWDVDSLDWKDPSPEQLCENVLKKVKNGSIILLHNGAKNTPQALPQLLQGLKDQGYSFVLVRDLIYTENYEIDHTGMQKKLEH